MEGFKMIKKMFLTIFVLFLLTSCDNGKQVLPLKQKPITTTVNEVAERPQWTNADGSVVPQSKEEYKEMLMYQFRLTQADLTKALNEFIKTRNEFCNEKTVKITISKTTPVDFYSLTITDEGKINELKNILNGMKNIETGPYATPSGGSFYALSYQRADGKEEIISCSTDLYIYQIGIENIAFAFDEIDYETIKPDIEKLNKYFDENAVLAQ
jgi:hypothetical protein